MSLVTQECSVIQTGTHISVKNTCFRDVPGDNGLFFLNDVPSGLVLWIHIDRDLVANHPMCQQSLLAVH